MALLETTTAEGALRGMILGRAPHELHDQEAAYLQDVLLHQPGFLDRRGAITGATSLGNNFSGRRPIGVTSCYDPAGNFRILVLYTKQNVGVSTSYDLCGSVFDSSLAYLGSIVLACPSTGGLSTVWTNFNAGPGTLVSTCPAIDGGVIISYGSGFGPLALRWVSRWWGGYSPSNVAFSDSLAVSNLAAAITTTVGSTAWTSTVADAAKITPGVFLQNIGIIKTVNYAAGTGTFQDPSALGNSGAGVSPVTRVSPIRTRGRISCAVGGNGTSITGYGTRFRENEGQSASIAVGRVWFVTDYDGTLIGSNQGNTGNDIPSDTQLTVTGAAGSSILLAKSLAPFKMWATSNAPYQKAQTNQLTPAFQKGSIVFTFAGYQFYSNDFDTTLTGIISSSGPKSVSRTWIGGPTWHNEMDHSPDDGNFFDAPPSVASDSAIYAGTGGKTSAVICRSRETFAVHGTSPDDFRIDKIANDGCLAPTAITQWQGNAIWLGRDGIWIYDGAHAPVNLVKDSMGLEWTKRVAAFQTEATTTDAGGYLLNQAHCFVYRDHLFVNVTNTGSTHTVYTDGVARTSNTMQLMIYLPNNAMTFLTNFNFVGFIPGWPPANQQEGYALLVQDSSTTHYLYPMSNFFKQGLATTDTILTANSYNSGTLSTSVGPWFHMESRKFFAGDGLLRKTWKQLSTESNLTNTKRMFLETVPGLNTTGTRVSTPYTGTGLWKALKLRFNSRDQYMSFRLYEDINNRPGTLRLGAWQWGYKLARRGQV